MSIVSTQYIFVSTANSTKFDNDNAEIFVDIPEDNVRARANEFIKLTLIQHSIVNNIPNVPTDGNLTINDVPFVIQAGTYRICDYVEKFNTFDPQVQATYVAIQNKIRFGNTGTAEVTLAFDKILADLFGVADITIPPQATVIGLAVIPHRVTDLVVSVRGVIPGPPTNIANLTPLGMTTTDVIGVIPLRSAPNTVNVYNNNNNSFEMHLYDTDVQRLGLALTDIRKQPIAGLPEWSAVLRCDVVRKITDDPVSERLERILGYLQLYTLMLAANNNTQADYMGTGLDQTGPVVDPTYSALRGLD
jgi:hypothetical protein